MKTTQEIADAIRPYAEILLIPEKEDHSYKDDKNYDDELKAVFTEMVKKYKLWGWCQVEVRVTYKGFTASAYLGGCSYKGVADFKAEGGYYEDMVQEALLEVATAIEDIINDPVLQ